MRYAHLNTTTNFTFLTGASHPPEYIYRAAELEYDALAITDECSLAGIVKAFVAAEELNFKLIVGSRFTLSNGMQLIAIAPNRTAYAELSGFITLARRRANKGEYEAHFDDLRFRLQHCLIIWIGHTAEDSVQPESIINQLYNSFKERLWIGINHQLQGGEQAEFARWLSLGVQKNIPLVACGAALMHEKKRKPLQDVVTVIRHNSSIANMGTKLEINGEAYLKSLAQLQKLYPESLLEQTCVIADLCQFSMTELRYQYPKELVPAGLTPIKHLRNLVNEGKQRRWPKGVPKDAEEILQKELELVEELGYEYFFLTVYDIVIYARKQNILCQGRGSSANSVICYCLYITEISPQDIKVLFERFISRERKEEPDIDVDFEHSRREEVIQYIYQKYGRERAAIAATVITYRSRSAVRDVGKALGMEQSLVDHLAKSVAWWDRREDLSKRIAASGLKINQKLLQHFFILVDQIRGFPRHLSQHVGGFVISQDKISDLVPIENASMPERTLIQWDKEDLESMNLLKVDVLALGMLTTLRKSLGYINTYDKKISALSDIPKEDSATYEMLCNGDSVGTFQVESRAQMAMLPRLKPKTFYDLVVQIAIVRPGPIQGGMVHPYLRRRNGLEKPDLPKDELKDILEVTYGVPIFQEQVIRIAMVAAGFSGGRADKLRRSMATWGKDSTLMNFEEEFIEGMLAGGYELDFAKRLFEQVKGFGGYGFPESHSASFAILAYASAWIKCHHPAAFYCALLNSQPMGFYSPSQLIQDARRHQLPILPIDINLSCYEHKIEKVSKRNKTLMGIRLGFCEIKSIDHEKAMMIEIWRGDAPFQSLKDLSQRSGLTAIDLQYLASADVLRSLSGNRHEARWEAAAIEPFSELLEHATPPPHDDLLTAAPTLEQDVLNDYATTGLSLRPHPMALLRNAPPFDRCTQYSDLKHLRHGGFVRVAGLVTGRQRPGTASGALFLTLEDETGNINVIVWKGTQETFRQVLLTSRLLLIKGTVEINNDNVANPVVHVIAGQLHDYSDRLENFSLKSRDFH
ncbi:error-prone DNA polymerase [Cellvibrio zantedeschiae]|uniref:Error-prone DNA polymerase n=1 Tax=Cellvibrio zantedeschiae TaxID=1237077 RepID=A0ABQ3B002_9GAMM|nr:error-prone DNA polymerase [Cellvibrio zantedeschiae]GGY72540.1 error-prone DNA polymerase [Cellvibrio zantedeschiae]